MINETIFIITVLICFVATVLAYYLGKSYLIGLITMCYLAANIFANKIIVLFDHTVTAGMALYACTVFATDLLAENYGAKEARKAVYVSFCAVACFIGFGYLVILLEPSEFGADMAIHLDKILGGSVRIAAASLVAYIIWQLIDIKIYDVIHKKTGSSMLWLRNNASTFTSQIGGVFTFMFLAFYGIAPWVELSITAIIFYWFLAATDTVFIYASKKITPRDIE